MCFFESADRDKMVDSTNSLSNILQCSSQSHNSAVDQALKLPTVYDFNSDEEDDVYAEEAFEAVLPPCAKFDTLSREEATK